MLKASTKKLIQRFLFLTLLVLSLFLFSRESTKSVLASSQANHDRTQSPAISIKSADDVPFRITNAFVESSGPGDFRIRLIVQNQSGQRIRAYAITADDFIGGGHSTQVEFVNLTKSTSILQPSQVTEASITYSPERLPESVTVAVDFVEFSDGSVAGPDSRNSRARLAGMREGAKREKQRLRDLLKRKGLSTMLDSIGSDSASDPEPNETSKPSAEWLEGFRSGIGSIRYRIKQAGQANDARQIELELAKPFDESEENQK